jgi:hypothetical protein
MTKRPKRVSRFIFWFKKGLSESELQIITDHANIKRVRHYAKTEIKRKKELMMMNIFELKRKLQIDYMS